MAPIDEVAHLALQVDRLLIVNGAETEHTQDAILRFAGAYGCEAHLAVSYEALILTVLSCGPEQDHRHLANGIAKDRPELLGICDLRDPDVQMALYRKMRVSEVWGIGGRTAERLLGIGVNTIEEFIRLDHQAVGGAADGGGRAHPAELRGISCLPLSIMLPPRKG